jgi:hypothetical protein
MPYGRSTPPCAETGSSIGELVELAVPKTAPPIGAGALSSARQPRACAAPDASVAETLLLVEGFFGQASLGQRHRDARQK